MATILQAFDYQEIAPRVQGVLREAFPENATIVTNPGYNGRVQAKIVSERLNGMSEPEKQTLLWDVLRAGLGEEAQAVSIAIGYGTDEL